MRRVVAALTLVVMCFGSVQAAPDQEKPPQKTLLQHLFSVRGFGLAGVSSAIQHIRVRPEEWGSNIGGFGKRYASSFGHHLVKGTVQFGLAKALHEDLKYYPSQAKGFRPRVGHALLSTVYARKTYEPGQTVATARISGEVAGGFLSRLWQPASMHTVAGGFTSSGISFAVDAGLNTLREFWPEIRHPLRSREQAKLDRATEIEVIELGSDRSIE
jgi:hypothetical protein